MSTNSPVHACLTTLDNNSITTKFPLLNAVDAFNQPIVNVDQYEIHETNLCNEIPRNAQNQCFNIWNGYNSIHLPADNIEEAKSKFVGLVQNFPTTQVSRVSRFANYCYYYVKNTDGATNQAIISIANDNPTLQLPST